MAPVTSEGALVSAGPEGIEGWAWDPARPYEPVEVELTANGSLLARVTADQFDMELVRERVGNGMHAFRVRLNTLPTGPYPLIVSARVVGGAELNGQIKFETPLSLKGIVDESAFQDYEGYVDGISDGTVVGWVWNRCLPDQPVLVSLYDGSVHIVDAVADGFRGDLASAGKGTGRCAFTLNLPLSMLDGGMHSLYVRVRGTNFQLGGTPIVFGPNSAQTLIDLIVQLRQEVDQLSQQLAQVMNPHSGVNRQFTNTLMERTEALLSIQRESLQSELRVLANSPSRRTV